MAIALAGSRAPFVERAPRVEIVLKVEFESVGQLRADFLSNLSAGGMFVRTPIPFAIGQVVSLSLSLPGVIDPPEKVEGVVRWLTPEQPEFMRGIGLAFKNLSPALEAKLKPLIAENATDGAPAAPSSRGSPPPSLPPSLAAPAGNAHAASAVALLVVNPILREIIKSELERLAVPAAGRRLAVSFVVSTALTNCLETIRDGAVSVVVADCDGIGVTISALLEALRGAAQRADLPIVVLHGSAVAPEVGAADLNTIALRKPVGMQALFTTLLALSSRRAR